MYKAPGSEKVLGNAIPSEAPPTKAVGPGWPTSAQLGEVIVRNELGEVAMAVHKKVGKEVGAMVGIVVGDEVGDAVGVLVKSREEVK
jgi:hypothetical protein